MRTFRTLFSGGELFGIGARQAGWQHMDGYEIDPRIAAVARLNGFDVRAADVCDVDYESLAPVDHLHASPSCKHASQANTGAGETEEDLAAAGAVCRAIRAHRGRTFSEEDLFEPVTWGYAVMASGDSYRRKLADGRVKVSNRGATVQSVAKAIRLQGLPTDFLSKAPFTVEGKQRVIGNGVPLPLGRAVAKAVRAALASVQASEQQSQLQEAQ